MEITIKINGQSVSVEVSYEVYEYLCESNHKAENLSHQKRRHWDGREFDEYIIATECSHIYTPTPEEILCHRETITHARCMTPTHSMLVCARLRHVAGTQWGNKKYMNMKHLEAAMDDASLVG